MYRKSKVEIVQDLSQIEPMPYIEKNDFTEKKQEELKNIGVSYIKQKKVAAITMAGGQRNKAWISWTKRNF